MLEILVILLAAALLLAALDWHREAAGLRRVTLRISALHYEPKTKLTMQTNLRSPVSQFAQLLLEPRDANGSRVRLDPDAIVAEVVTGEGAKATVAVLDRDNGDRDFLVNLVPGDAPGEYSFKVRGDAEPGEGVAILEEDFVYTATPNNAVTLGASVQYLAKTSLPA